MPIKEHEDYFNNSNIKCRHNFAELVNNEDFLIQFFRQAHLPWNTLKYMIKILSIVSWL